MDAWRSLGKGETWLRHTTIYMANSRIWPSSSTIMIFSLFFPPSFCINEALVTSDQSKSVKHHQYNVISIFCSLAKSAKMQLDVTYIKVTKYLGKHSWACNNVFGLADCYSHQPGRLAQSQNIFNFCRPATQCQQQSLGNGYWDRRAQTHAEEVQMLHKPVSNFVQYHLTSCVSQNSVLPGGNMIISNNIHCTFSHIK